MLVPKPKTHRWLTALMAVFTLAAATMLAIGVGDLELKPGQAIAPRAVDRGAFSSMISQIQVPAGILEVLAAVLRIGALLLLPFAVLHLIRSPAARKQVLVQLFYLLLISIAILTLSRSLGAQQFDQPSIAPPQAVAPSAAPDFAAALPQAPRWLINAASVIGAAVVAFIGYRLYRQTRAAQPPASQIAADAQQALAEIEAGEQLENVVLRAYHQLCVSSRRRKGVTRNHSHTAREFRLELRQVGIPAQALDQLTALFEKARYGDRQLDQHDERRAIAALRTILRSLGEL